jgi:hypothetical protein
MAKWHVRFAAVARGIKLRDILPTLRGQQTHQNLVLDLIERLALKVPPLVAGAI